MAEGHFGIGVISDEPGAAFHEWPIKSFVRHFKGVETDDDWKAVIYKWGGPLPRFIERTELRHEAKRGVVRICYWLRTGTTYEDQTRGHAGI